MQKLLIVSFDAVGDDMLNWLLEDPEAYPNVARFYSEAFSVRGARSVFPTNTYPVHTCISTGKYPRDHGIVSNVDPFPAKDKEWWSDSRRIKAKTLWRAAAEKRLKTAAVMWPVTAYAKHMYNIPEVLPKPGKSQVMASLRAGSKFLQVKEYLRHRQLLRGIEQPERDSFATRSMVDIINEKAPALMLMHLTAFDTLCHTYGRSREKLLPALASLDENLGLLLEAAGPDCAVVVFSDHSQLNVENIVLPNDWLAARGLIEKTSDGYAPGPSGCFVECCGGCAFFHAGSLAGAEIDAARAEIERSEGFGRFLTADEMDSSGHAAQPFGFAAAPGYSYDTYAASEKANHGYPVDYENYGVFYMVRAAGFAPGARRQGGDIIDITRIAADILNIDM